jgi:hypothetical protein
MLELFAVSQIYDDNVIFQQDDAPDHYANIVTDFFDETFPRPGLGGADGSNGPHAFRI